VLDGLIEFAIIMALLITVGPAVYQCVAFVSVKLAKRFKWYAGGVSFIAMMIVCPLILLLIFGALGII
jgi:hypothetical protein